MKKLLFFSVLTACTMIRTQAASPDIDILNVQQGNTDPTAKVVFKVDQEVSSDGSGYQMLFDSQCQTYGMLDISINGIRLPDDVTAFHSLFDYTLPEGAEADCVSPVVKNGESDTLLLPEGNYDMLLLNPSVYVEECVIYPVQTKYGAMGNISLASGKTYVFELKRGSFGSLDLNMVLPYDLVVEEIVRPVSSLLFTGEEPLEIRISNQGDETIPSGTVSLGFSLDGTPGEPELLGQSLAPGESREYVFTQKLDLSSSTRHHLSVWASCPGDIILANDTVEKEIELSGICGLPYHEDFSSDTSIGKIWSVVDANQDMISWEWEDDTLNAVDHELGSVGISFSQQHASDDYLISPAIRIPQGDANLTFMYRAASVNYPERMAVLYGNRPEIESMKVVDTISNITNETFQIYPFNFHQEEEAVIYFAFHAISDADRLGIYIDEVQVNQGVYEGECDLALEAVVIPPSGCELEDAQVSLEISNVGNDNVKQLEAYYVLQGSQDTVREIFDVSINVGGRKRVDFEQRVQFPAERTTTLHAGIYPLSSEKEVENNRMSVNGTHYSPLTEFPALLSISRQQVRPVDPESWKQVADTLVALQAGSPIISHCLSLEPGCRYRISYEYLGGEMVLWAVPDAYRILVGKAFTDRKEWKIIKEDNTVYSTFFVPGECMFETDATGGEYIFAVEATEIPSNLRFCHFQVTKVEPHDARLSELHSGISNLYTYRQMEGSRVANVLVTNRGTDVLRNMKVNFTENGTVIGQADVQELDPDSSVNVKVPYKAVDVLGKTSYRLKGEVVLSQVEDGYPADNFVEQEFILNDTLMSWDGLESDQQLYGDYEIMPSEPKRYGMPYYLAVKDTLTSLTIGWCTGFERTLSLLINRWDPIRGEMGDTIYHNTLTRGSAKGFMTYQLPSIVLENGDYMVSIAHETSNVMGLAGDRDKNGFVYEIRDGKAIRNTSWGYAAIRLGFHPTESDHTYDVALVSIEKPETVGIFSQTEPVSVKVSNLGPEPVSEVSLSCYVNDEKVQEKKVSLSAYQTFSVEFVADLSQPEQEYEIKVVSTYGKDPNPLNDTVVKTVQSLAAVNPYRMDFEHCADFSFDGWNPEWKSVDRDGVPTSGFQDVSYPGKEQPTGFMAFNPYKTEPAMYGPDALVSYDRVSPIQGYKFGVSFCATTSMNDDWLISPKLKLPKKNASMSFYVRSYSEIDGPEQYKVLISEKTDNIEDFKVIRPASTAPTEWEKIEVDLGDYAGQEVYLAIQCITFDGFVFMVDDIRVSDPNNPSGNDVIPEMESVSLYPNPAREQVYVYAGQNTVERVEIYSLQGVRVLEWNTVSGQSSVLLELPSLTSGVYVVRIKTSQGIVTRKLSVM